MKKIMVILSSLALAVVSNLITFALMNSVSTDTGHPSRPYPVDPLALNSYASHSMIQPLEAANPSEVEANLRAQSVHLNLNNPSAEKPNLMQLINQLATNRPSKNYIVRNNSVVLKNEATPRRSSPQRFEQRNYELARNSLRRTAYSGNQRYPSVHRKLATRAAI